ncbi:7132_t:CDS:2, partial [Scutellospora calospora]
TLSRAEALVPRKRKSEEWMLKINGVKMSKIHDTRSKSKRGSDNKENLNPRTTINESGNKPSEREKQDSNKWFDMTEEEQTQDTITFEKQAVNDAPMENYMESSGKLVDSRSHDTETTDSTNLNITPQLQNTSVGVGPQYKKYKEAMKQKRIHSEGINFNQENAYLKYHNENNEHANEEETELLLQDGDTLENMIEESIHEDIDQNMSDKSMQQLQIQGVNEEASIMDDGFTIVKYKKHISKASKSRKKIHAQDNRTKPYETSRLSRDS